MQMRIWLHSRDCASGILAAYSKPSYFWQVPSYNGRTYISLLFGGFEMLLSMMLQYFANHHVYVL
jgi:hypothetical protein